MTERQKIKMEMHEMSLVKIGNRWATLVLVLNILLPGIGTMIAGCLAGGDSAINNIIVGLLQIVLTPFFLVGWFWSLILGLQIYSLS